MSLKETMQLRVDEAFLKSLDFLRRSEEDIPTRSEMIRRLTERAAAAKQPKKPKS